MAKKKKGTEGEREAAGYQEKGKSEYNFIYILYIRMLVVAVLLVMMGIIVSKVGFKGSQYIIRVVQVVVIVIILMLVGSILSELRIQYNLWRE